MDIESIFRRASSAPLGPLSLSYTAAGPDAWALSVSIGDSTALVRAEPDPKTEGLTLVRQFPASVKAPPDLAGRPWLIESRQAEDGALEVRLWLHGDGLSSAMLINALATLAAVNPEAPAAPTTAVPPPPIPIVVPEPEPKPEPIPVATHRGLSWESFASGRSTASPADPSAVENTAVPATDTSSVETTSSAETPPAADSTAKAAQDQTSPTVTESPLDPAPEPVTPATVETVETRAVPATPGGDQTLPKPAGRAGYCRECGSPYAADHAFCTNCGARLD